MTNMFSFLNYLPPISTALIFKVCITVVMLITIRMIIKGLSPIINNFCQKNNFDQHSCLMMHKLSNGLILVIGSAIIMQNLGIEMSMLIAAFGIFGVILSYGLKDFVANFIASVLVIAYKDIKINDHVKFNMGWQGQIVDINLRYTTLKNNDEKILIPNIIMYTQAFSVIKKE